jgi:3-carboxy-cis,cis-muconate cycloisomerase
MMHALQLLAPLGGDPEVEGLLSADAHVRAMLDVEVALAEAQAALGVIPAHVTSAIRAAACDEPFELAPLAEEAARAGNVAIPLVNALTARVARISSEAAGYVHWGATSQDVIDTAVVLQLRGAVRVVSRRLAGAAAAAATHARRHATTLMPGRTWLQHAVPITFGLKAAGWLDALNRSADGLDDALAGASVVQFGGAAGTLAALGPHGDAVASALAERLGLVAPDMPWHAHRDRLARLAGALGVVAGTLGKIARDTALMGQAEVGEVAERSDPGRGGSSTMPQKQNPIDASVALAAATRAPGLVATLLAAMSQEHERGLGGWQAEWATMPVLVALTAGAARAVASLLEGLEVNVARMRANVDATGLLTAEAVTVALAPALGRREAYQRVARAARLAREQGRPLARVLADDESVMRTLGEDGIAAACAPEGCLGMTRVFVERVLARHDARLTGRRTRERGPLCGPGRDSVV